MWAKWIAEFKKKERIQKENKLIFRLSVIITSVSVYSDLFLVGEKNKDWNIFFSRIVKCVAFCESSGIKVSFRFEYSFHLT